MDEHIDIGDVVEAWSSAELKFLEFTVIDVDMVLQYDLSRGPFRMFTTNVRLVRKGACDHVAQANPGVSIFDPSCPWINFCWRCGAPRPS